MLLFIWAGLPGVLLKTHYQYLTYMSQDSTLVTTCGIEFCQQIHTRLTMVKHILQYIAIHYIFTHNFFSVVVHELVAVYNAWCIGN